MHSKKALAIAIIILSPIAIVAVTVLSVLYGAKSIDASIIWNAVFRFNPDNVNHQIIMHSRMPRVIGALLIGAFLAVSGAMMQGMTRNYLASPSIMGVSDGSAFVITLCMIVVPAASSIEMIFFSLFGSLFGVAVVWGLASSIPGGLSPVRMAIIGTVIGTLLSSIATAIAVYFQISQNIGFWYHARLHQMDPQLIKLIIPFAIVGFILAISATRSITTLSLGEDVAAGLGQKTFLVKLITTASVVILTGISVALAGKIGFVGVIVPHIARMLVWLDYRWMVPCAGLLGALFLGFADVLSRFINYPFETPVGVVTAIIGVPFFLYLIRKKGGGERA